MLFDALAGNPSEEEYEEEETKKKMFPGRKSKQAQQRGTKLRCVLQSSPQSTHSTHYRTWESNSSLAKGHN
jgi:hypothetical protein